MKRTKILFFYSLFSLFSLSKLIHADGDVKRELKNNSTLTEFILPSNVDTLKQLFTEGIFYGRIRWNTFLFDWDEEKEGSRRDHYTMGIGGSFIYKSAYLYGFGFTAGLYTSQNPWHMDDEDVIYYKVGKGVLSRYDVATEGKYGLSSLAQVYLEYKNTYTSVRLGRQIFESVMTKSNDIKMIPNTFEGVTLHSTVLPNHTFRAAFLRKQKLRDHIEFHHLFAYDDGEGKYDKWRENDDTAMHQGITLSKLKAKGIDDRLLITEIDNGKKQDYSWLFNYTIVPELFSSATLDMGYKWVLNGYMIAPALRYMHQFDHGAGEMGGANLKTNTVGYKDPESVEADLYGVRIDVAKENWKIRAGMSHIDNQADIISPWRSFPTGGFGYSLLQYNWYANTTSYLVQADHDMRSYDLHLQFRFAIQDFDDAKAGVQADSHVHQLDLIKRFTSMPNLYAKLRMVNVNADKNTIALNGYEKPNLSYRDIRFEVNYLF